MIPEELAVIIEKHRKWLAGDPEGEKADLTWSNLICADLHGVDLTGATLTGANLTGANLTLANLTGATLHRDQVDALLVALGIISDLTNDEAVAQ